MLGSIIGGALGIGSALIGGNAASKAAKRAMQAQIAAIGKAKEENTALHGERVGEGGLYDQFMPGIEAALREGQAAGQGYRDPLIASGDRATSEYETLSGLKGEDARSARVNAFMERPEFKAADKVALDGVNSQFGARGASMSGAAMAALAKTRLAGATSYINGERQALTPLMSIGASARGASGQAATAGSKDLADARKFGFAYKDQAQSDLRQGNANAELSIGNSQANYQQNKGNIQASMWGAIGGQAQKGFSGFAASPGGSSMLNSFFA